MTPAQQAKAKAKAEGLNAFPCVVKYNYYGGYNALAGRNRNAEMRKDADFVIAFWDGKSKGTNEMIKSCQKSKIPLLVYNYMT